MSTNQFTPGQWLAIPIGPDMEQYSVIVTDKKQHEEDVERATDGNIEYNYIPLAKAAAAPEMYEALKSILRNANDILASIKDPVGRSVAANLRKIVLDAISKQTHKNK